jgi:hypothetical protein
MTTVEEDCYNKNHVILSGIGYRALRLRTPQSRQPELRKLVVTVWMDRTQWLGLTRQKSAHPPQRVQKERQD